MLRQWELRGTAGGLPFCSHSRMLAGVLQTTTVQREREFVVGEVVGGQGTRRAEGCSIQC